MSRAERSKDHNKATAVTTKLHGDKTLICFTEYTLKRIENIALLRHATLKCESAFTRTVIQAQGHGYTTKKLLA